MPVDANGQASSAVHANNVAGRYAVTVTTGGLITPVVFTLTNTPLSVSVARTGTGKGLVISSPAGVVCAPLCAAGFDYGRLVTFTATANTGSIFTGWVDDTAGGTYSTPDPDTAALYTALADAMPDSMAAAVPGSWPEGVPGSGPEAVPVDGLATALLAAARADAVLTQMVRQRRRASLLRFAVFLGHIIAADHGHLCPQPLRSRRRRRPGRGRHRRRRRHLCLRHAADRNRRRQTWTTASSTGP